MGQVPDPSRKKRRAALAGHLGDIDAARQLLADDDLSVRSTALGALARAGGLTGSDLASALTDPQAVVRRRAVEILASLPDGDPLATDLSLLRLLDDPDDSVVEVAAWACGERAAVEPAAVHRLSELAVDHPDALVREAAVAALGALGDELGLPAILVATSDKATVRRRAVLALASFEGPDVESALQRACTDRDWQVRQAAEDLTTG